MADEDKKKKGSARAPRELDALDKKTLKLILETAERVRSSIDKRVLPEMRFPERSLGNVKYDAKIGYFELGKNRKARALTVNTVKTFAQTLRLMAISKEMVENNDFATKREAYYVSKNWGEAKFNDQPESDTVLDDIEALASLDGLAREQLRYYPEEHGGSVAGNLTVIDVDPQRNVLLVSPSTLMFVVRTVAHLWRQEAQTRNAQEIAKRGAELYDKLCSFVGDLQQVGDRLRQAREAYEQAESRLHLGKGNAIRQAEMLRELGVKASKRLPEALVLTPGAWLAVTLPSQAITGTGTLSLTLTAADAARLRWAADGALEGAAAGAALAAGDGAALTLRGTAAELSRYLGSGALQVRATQASSLAFTLVSTPAAGSAPVVSTGSVIDPELERNR